MEVDEAPHETGKAVIRPRRPGENIKVAETVLKRRDRNLKDKAERAAQVARIRQQQKQFKKGKLKIIRAEKLVKNCLTRDNDRKRLKNMPKKKKPKPWKGKVLAVARNGRMGGSKEVKLCLKELGLRMRHTLVFQQNNEETLQKLNTCKPFVFWGPPSFKAVFNLVHKKALFRDPDAEGGKTALSDNVLIEKHLGDLGVLCTEDLAHVVHNATKHFSEVTARLWPVPIGDAKKARGLVHDKKFTYGDQQRAINLKLEKLLGE
mmetsp:Transcript_1959/g.4470  ORF Transcript_1959/g.4470 Transcript_1959/m.4470 type:complete len:262 (-) Transcript_1959:250-1035(-)